MAYNALFVLAGDDKNHDVLVHAKELVRSVVDTASAAVGDLTEADVRRQQNAAARHVNAVLADAGIVLPIEPDDSDAYAYLADIEALLTAGYIARSLWATPEEGESPRAEALLKQAEAYLASIVDDPTILESMGADLELTTDGSKTAYIFPTKAWDWKISDEL